jgi:hypothetical protein
MNREAEEVTRPIGSDRERQVDGFAAHDAFVANRDAQRVKEDHRILTPREQKKWTRAANKCPRGKEKSTRLRNADRTAETFRRDVRKR